MPRRKQGQSQETTGGEHMKKADGDEDQVQNDSTKKMARQKEVVSQNTKLFPVSVVNLLENGYIETSTGKTSVGKQIVVAESLEGRTLNPQCLNAVINSSLPLSSLDGENVGNEKSFSLCDSSVIIKDYSSCSNSLSHHNSDSLTQTESSHLFSATPGVLSISKKSWNVQNSGQLPFASSDGSESCGRQNSVQSDVFHSENMIASDKIHDQKSDLKTVSDSVHTTSTLKVQKVIPNATNLCGNTTTHFAFTRGSVIDDPDERHLGTSRHVLCDSRRESHGEMSGISPAIAASSNQGICPEVHQLNYRISTSVTETKCTTGSTDATVLSNNESSIMLENQNSYNLPSSVYGTSASNIETKLVGLHLSNQDKLTAVKNSPLISIKNNFLQSILENQSVFDKSVGLPENSESITTQEKSFNVVSKLQENEAMVKVNAVQTTSNRVLKLHIPDISVSTDSDSSQQTFPDATKVKMPKITSPQILEQHISKIISENAAIVETLDPLWSRRYLKQSSLTNGQELEARKLYTHPKARRFSEERLVNNVLSSDKICQSKLQAALLGGFDTDSQHCSQSQSVNTSNPLLSSSCSFASDTSSPVSFNRPVLASAVIAPKSASDIINEEELKGSANRSIAGLNQTSCPVFGNSISYSHPQNPEGSIIKDLLLKNKSKHKSSSLIEFTDEKKPSKDNTNETPMFVYQCTGCKLGFRTKDLINEHLVSCSALNKFAARDNCENKNSVSTEKPEQIKSALHEKLENISSGFSVSFTDSNGSTLSSNEVKISENTHDGIGHILKKQLLSPISKRREVLSKKRKISEPVFSVNKQESNLFQSLDLGHTGKSDVFSQHLDGLTLSPHRCRSQSVHLFGGEVQILDGIQTKKMKITNNFHGALTPTTNSFSNNPSFGKFSSSDFSCSVNNFASLPTVVVTIAQPVHNSGGTVTHLSTVPPLLSFSPVMTISNHLMSTDMENFSVVKSSPSKNLSLIGCEQNLPTFPMLAVELMKKSKSDELTQSTKNINSLNISVETSSFLSREFCTASDSSQNLHLPGTSKSSSTTAVSNVNDYAFSTKSFSFAAHIPTASAEENKTNVCTASSSLSTNCWPIPTVTFTPSSPTHPSSSEGDCGTTKNPSEEENPKKFLAPTRPTSLPFKKKPFTMVGSTLISPETPRPKKSCIQLYLNGHAYTYLGLKCSTRSTYCCIYRPQPMYVPQDTNPKLSMYSNWQVVPAKEELCGMTPGQMMFYYNSRQGLGSPESVYTTAKISDPLSFTHSSYWVFRSQEELDKQEPLQELFGEMSSKSDNPAPTQVSAVSYSSENSQNASMEHDSVSNHLQHSTVESENQTKTKDDTTPSSSDECSFPAEGSSVFSGVEENGAYDEEDYDDDDAHDDGTSSQTDSSLPQPPKRVKIFEGGFKSNEDYTYVRGRGRGKYVCEECGIRCKKPSMLKKHIRTHTDLRPYKCRHCSFAFKTKGNLTKHMKSKAHHKKCTELGIIPVPTTTDDSQIDEEALAKQEQLERKNPQFSDGEDADDDEDDEMDDDYDDSDGLDDDCGSDSGSMAANQNTRSATNGLSKNLSSWENVNIEQFDDNGGDPCDTSQRTVEQEAARSLLHLSALSEPSQWPATTAEMTDISSSSGETKIVSPSPSTSNLSAQPTGAEVLSVSATAMSSPDIKMSTDQQPSQLWIAPEPLGHRPRSYSADIPFSGFREQHHKVLVRSDTSIKVTDSLVKDSSEVGTKEHYARRYSISVAREARRPTRILQAPNWSSSDLSNSVLNKWPEVDVSDQPMDLTVSRSSNCNEEKSKLQFCPVALVGTTTVISTSLSQGTLSSETHVPLSSEENIGDQLHSKSLPILSPHVMNEFDGGGENNSSDAGITISDNQASFCANNDQQSFCTNSEQTSFGPNTDQPSFCTSTSQSSFLYIPDINLSEAQLSRKDMDTMEEQHSPEVPDYAACSPITPPPQEENSAYYYPQEGFAGGSVMNSIDELHSTPRSHAEFIVPSTSINMEEGRCICRICNKVFAKSSQLRLHVNIHYFERPFRCDNCAVSFRTKGHLQKHKRSVSHYNKVNMNMTFGTPTVDNPRPFKCADCKIAFRIHGHLAKHLRSKMHIMKLECLGKLPFGMYAEMERSGVSLNEIDTTDCNNSLESLQVMAQRLYQRDPRRMRWHNPDQAPTEIESAKSTTPLTPIADALVLPDQHQITSVSSPVSIPTPSAINTNQNSNSRGEGGEVKQEPSDVEVFRTASAFSDSESPISPPLQVDSNASLHRSGTCHICGRLFKSAKFLQVHLYCDHASLNPTPVDKIPSQTVANNPGHPSVAAQDLSCDLCGKMFPNQSNLQQHLLSHAQPRPFVCEICDAGFTSSALLVAHLATHQQINTSGCSESGLVQLR